MQHFTSPLNLRIVHSTSHTKGLRLRRALTTLFDEQNKKSRKFTIRTNWKSYAEEGQADLIAPEFAR